MRSLAHHHILREKDYLQGKYLQLSNNHLREQVYSSFEAHYKHDRGDGLNQEYHDFLMTAANCVTCSTMLESTNCHAGNLAEDELEAET